VLKMTTSVSLNFHPRSVTAWQHVMIQVPSLSMRTVVTELFPSFGKGALVPSFVLLMWCLLSTLDHVFLLLHVW
jgi:hypothetical protein